MAALVKELFLDLSLNRLPVDIKSDLLIAVETVFKSGVFTARDLKIFNYYLEGYTAKEISEKTVFTERWIEVALERIFSVIEAQSGYTDAAFIRKIEMNPDYIRTGVTKLKQFLIEHGKHFDTHEVGKWI